MITRIIISAAVIIISLAAINITAYAYFSCNIVSGTNTIKSANFEVDISIKTAKNDEMTADRITPTTSDNVLFRISGLRIGETYTVTITPTEDSTATTGFIILRADGCDEIYHTQQLGVDTDANGSKTKEITFNLMITDATDVIFEAHWGTSSHYANYKDTGDNEELYITQKETIKMIVNGVEEPKTNEVEEESDVNQTDEEEDAQDDMKTEIIPEENTESETTSQDETGSETEETEELI